MHWHAKTKFMLQDTTNYEDGLDMDIESKEFEIEFKDKNDQIVRYSEIKTDSGVNLTSNLKTTMKLIQQGK